MTAASPEETVEAIVTANARHLAQHGRPVDAVTLPADEYDQLAQWLVDQSYGIEAKGALGMVVFGVVIRKFVIS